MRDQDTPSPPSGRSEITHPAPALAELRRLIAAARAAAVRIGPQHAAWDVIADAEALLAGKPTICSRADIEAALAHAAQSPDKSPDRGGVAD